MAGGDDAELERTERAVERAKTKRSTVINQIKNVHQYALRLKAEPELGPTVTSLAGDLDALWIQCRTEDDAVLDGLVELGRLSEYNEALLAEVRTCISACKIAAATLVPKGAEAVDVSYLKETLGSTGASARNPAHDHAKPSARLPEIPLPEFNGDFRLWPTFRDRFTAQVDSRDISNIDKMYYLIGCLKGDAAEALRGIPVSADNYVLAWSVLSERFYRPRLVATSLVDKLLNSPSMSQESLSDLNNFVSTFNEGISLLEALNVPNMGSFILFTVAFRRLPVATRKLFESDSKAEYPSIGELLKFVRTRVSILEVVSDPPKVGTSAAQASKAGKPSGIARKVGDYVGKSNGPRPMSFVTAKGDATCPCCAESHALGICARFKSWSAKGRTKWARENRVCFNCLNVGHWIQKCKSKPNCKECSRKHHTLLHLSPDELQGGEEPPPVEPAVCASVVNPPSLHRSSAVVLGTALVHVRDNTGSVKTMRALMDSASQISAVTAACVKRLGLKISRWTAPISGLSGTTVAEVQGQVECIVQPRFASDPILPVQAWVLPTITTDLPQKSLSIDIKNRYSNLALADPSFHLTSPIDLLLGGDVYGSIMDGRKVSIDSTLPTAFSSVFGWILIGPVPDRANCYYQSLPVSMTASIEGIMERFWHVEEPEDAPVTFTEEGSCEQIFRDEATRLTSGRFAVPLPFRAPAETFVGSREVATRRFDAIERKLSASPVLKSLYVNFMSEYIALGHMSVATSPGRYIIPHHAVYRPEVDPNKIRVVFDASARCFRGPSLNECLWPGPKLQQDIVDVLTRFRVHKYTFTTDICKMYRQILILPEYRKFQHVLWRASPHDELREYELHTVTYGVNCAPYLALRVLQAIASTDCDGLDSVRNALEYQTYVDDICDGADTISDVLKLQSDLVSVLSKSGLELKKWASNTPAVLQAVPAADRACAPMPFGDDDGYGTKVLGLAWHPDQDYFCCALSLEPSPVFTKRGILSLVARIFDPLGLFGPVVFLAKSIMQRTWRHSVAWDDPLPDDIHADWVAFVSELPSLLGVRVPRHINGRQGAPCYLLGFCDASQVGYAAVVYVRMINIEVDKSVFLIGTKTKLAPTKALTVPRLELNAAVLLARWLGRIQKILSPQLDVVGLRAWSDSTIVLSWLTAPHESFKVYVSNRVHQIRSLLPDCYWQHIVSADNPADCASRGVMPAALARLDLYWRGPQIAYGEPSEWDDSRPSLPLCDLPELRVVSCAARVDNEEREWFVRFSNFDRMLRVVAYMRRFVEACHRNVALRRSGVTGSVVTPGSDVSVPTFLRKNELDIAARVLAAESQRVHFAVLRQELAAGARISSKPLARLAPFIDTAGIVRVGGRLRHSLLNYDCKHPVLLAKRSHYAMLLCRRWHLLSGHAGPRVLAALIARQYWVMSLRSVLHNVLINCTVCVRLDAKPSYPFMADLPGPRVKPRRPFEQVGVDYAGPLQLKELRLRKSRMFKIYIAVFVCFTTKAVHLEVVTELSTDAFLAAFDRFVARRGLPADVYSDCGTNFVGADKQLRALIQSPEGQTAVANFRAMCTWHFNPPSAPHFGGLWEAAVRSTKRLLVRVIGTHVFTYEEFTTVLTRIEAVLNSRPLTPASTDPHDLECLTPGHFLIGQPLLAVPPRSGPEPARNLSDRWKLLDQCHRAFWRRWSAEYLTTLQSRPKWTEGVPNLSLNDMVVVIDSQSPPLLWRLGRVIELLPGSDGHVRVARILTRAGVVTRPVVKLVKLPTNVLS
ncbi:uncharacterized protein LOC103310776 [Acyrthosiphon pisum]|uniref:Integrase catalytic domain-containing protein n=1 Tax=Acyrthosiphon pisum TaxID=7029 RepID=A0A8R2FC34_ACYPI|nr:uncharacterized protein LOC103310776 [Acyrthosiphon pisum]|eukprot:XP_008188319.1 PREDICTED: uncharacterized protein LOC103310776 [Acyrthosiphon pisum]